MKIGKVSGTPEEIKDFLVNNGFKAGDFLDLAKKIELKWIIIPASLFIANSFILWVANRPSFALFGFLIIIELSVICWLTASVHYRFNNIFISGLCLLFLLLIFSFCMRFIELYDAIKTIQDKIKLSSHIF